MRKGTLKHRIYTLLSSEDVWFSSDDLVSRLFPSLKDNMHTWSMKRSQLGTEAKALVDAAEIQSIRVRAYSFKTGTRTRVLYANNTLRRPKT